MYDVFCEQMAHFYESRNYRPSVRREVARPQPGSDLSVVAEEPGDAVRLMAYFHRTSGERAGTLAGDYLLMPDAHLLVTQDGACVRANAAWEDHQAVRAFDYQYDSIGLREALPAVLAKWEQYPLIEDPCLLSDIYVRNYYHFSTEVIPRLRFFPPQATLLVQEGALSFAFQRDLLVRTMGARTLLPMRQPVRVRDPFCAFGRMSTDDVLYLRAASGLRARPGARRLYLRRSWRFSRGHAGGGIAEDEALQAILRVFGFETIDFGRGERSVAEQVALLDGAGLILAPHGAGMTNLAYLEPPVRVVEVMGPRAARACFMHISACTGLRHTALFTRRYDEEDNLLVDPALLRECLLAD
jgi:hypothetical protein